MKTLNLLPRTFIGCVICSWRGVIPSDLVFVDDLLSRCFVSTSHIHLGNVFE